MCHILPVVQLTLHLKTASSRWLASFVLVQVLVLGRLLSVSGILFPLTMFSYTLCALVPAGLGFAGLFFMFRKRGSSRAFGAVLVALALGLLCMFDGLCFYRDMLFYGRMK